MRNGLRIIYKTLITLLIIFCTLGTMAQGGPPNPPSDPGTGDNNTQGGGAPIGGGLFILLGLGGAYAGVKGYVSYAKNKESLED